ncbi:hypothetical protein [Streptomyces johnsoniae]|uniref:Uncharacterized protein n=1 Tax=Streptomyces johnsoniae TaxID=3075532 RepID=A0ABU2RZF5_9ACTN|nr:hypothetical protein [Streptomyces sp. DSM 41886]MDT0441200.1 hypothetical protein [Streptomyces sp. DSM 41886]
MTDPTDPEEQHRQGVNAAAVFELHWQKVLRRRSRKPRWARTCPGTLIVMATGNGPVTVPCVCCQGGSS